MPTSPRARTRKGDDKTGFHRNPSQVFDERDEVAAARALFEQAEQALEAARFEEAAEVAIHALDAARECGDVSMCGRSLAVLAVARLRTGHGEAAYSAACNAQRLLTKVEDTSRRLRALNVCALVRLGIGDEVSAVDIWRHALKSSTGEMASYGRRLMMDNLAERLIRHGDYREAIQCLLQSVLLAKQAPEQPGQYSVAASGLAYAHVRYADHLAQTGRNDDAQEQLCCAARVLPPFDASGWRSFSLDETHSLWPQIEVLSALGDFPKARSAAAAGFLRSRLSPRSLRYRADALVTAACLYRRGRQTQHAIRCERRALLVWHALAQEEEIVEVMRRLATLHAACGEYVQAHQLRKDVAARVASTQRERSALGRRLAVIEQEAQSQLADAHEMVAHAQRLSIIGRLIGQIHHALQAPIQRTQQLCVLALRAYERAAAVGQPAPGMPALLSAISQSIDEAANLSRQLKIYAYRSSPITTTVSIDTSLREVWQTLRPHVSERARELRVVGDTGLHVHADPQRLGVLLTLMLIELVKSQASSAAPVVVTASIEAAAPASVALMLDSETASDTMNEDGATVALIETLCREIAAEMGATLTCTHRGGTVLRCTLVAPDADAGTVFD